MRSENSIKQERSENELLLDVDLYQIIRGILKASSTCIETQADTYLT